jgi:agmatine/peptidylarginine deiminase
MDGKPEVRIRKQAAKLSQTVSTQTRSIKPWNMATPTEWIQHIIILPQGSHPHSHHKDHQVPIYRLTSIVAMLETMERREETTLMVSRKKNQQMALLLRDAQVEVTNLTKQETMKIIASTMIETSFPVVK